LDDALAAHDERCSGVLECPVRRAKLLLSSALWTVVIFVGEFVCLYIKLRVMGEVVVVFSSVLVALDMLWEEVALAVVVYSLSFVVYVPVMFDSGSEAAALRFCRSINGGLVVDVCTCSVFDIGSKETWVAFENCFEGDVSGEVSETFCAKGRRVIKIAPYSTVALELLSAVVAMDNPRVGCFSCQGEDGAVGGDGEVFIRDVVKERENVVGVLYVAEGEAIRFR
jgi:hypothetical protein